MPAVDRPPPAYVQISDEIVRRIESGELAEGALIPSTREIISDWSVSNTTASRVHARLRKMGYISPIAGVGSVVRTRSAGTQAHARAVRETGYIYPADEYARILSAELIDAPAEVAAEMGIPVGTSVVRRERVRWRKATPNDIPLSASTSWMPGHLADKCPELLTTERIKGGALDLALERAGMSRGVTTEESWADAATEDDAAALNVSVGAPVTRARMWFDSSDDSVVEFSTSTRAQGVVTRINFLTPEV